MINEANPDTIVFPSGESVRMFFEENAAAELFPAYRLQGINVVSMGEKTTTALKFYGVIPTKTVETPTSSSLVDAILKCPQ